MDDDEEQPPRAVDPAPPPIRLGIGVTTFNRRDRLAACLDAIAQHTTAPHELVVADDGSSDGTIDLLRARGVRTVAGPNRGIAWNKNRALYALHSRLRCDVVILIEDDTFPTVPGWQEVWVAAAQRWGHANLAGHWFRERFIAGTGTIADPVVSPVITGQVVSFHRHAIEAVGYMDTRFTGYGFEHCDHTERMVRAGFGGLIHEGQQYYLLFEGGVQVTDGGSHANPATLEANRLVIQASRTEFWHRAAFRTEEECRVLMAELADLPG